MADVSRSQQVVKHFDHLSETGAWSHLYSVFDPLTYHFHVRRTRVLELLPARLGDVLDIGCGPGVMVEAVKARGGAFHGVDVSPQMVHEALEQFGHLPGVSVTLGDIEDIPFPAETFDQVICMAVLEYLSTGRKALDEIARVLRPGGTAIVTMPRRYHIDRLTWRTTSPFRTVARAVTGKSNAAPPKLVLEPMELDSLAVRSGLTPDGLALYQFTPLPYPITRAFPTACLRINLRFEKYSGTVNPVLRFLAHGFVARYRKLAHN